MIKALKKQELTGDVSRLMGDVSGLRGNVSGLRGNVSGLLMGDVSRLLMGDVSGLTGDVDDCHLTEEERTHGVNVQELVG